MINSYLTLQNGQETGPYTLYELMDQGIDARTMVLSPLTAEWQEACDLPELSNYFETQGIYVPNRSVLANFWWRLLAYLIDYIIIIITIAIVIIIFYLVTALLGRVVYTQNKKSDDAIYNIWGIIAMITYHSVLEATPLRGGIGKKICKLAVVDENGGRITFGKALSRNLGKILSFLVLGIGFLSILWDHKRQGWHDGLAHTYVIRKA